MIWPPPPPERLATLIDRAGHGLRRQVSRRSGLTILELLITVAIIGLIVALVLPAIGAARESARRIECVHHLREVGLALQQHHGAAGCLPEGWKFEPSGKTAFGWAASTLPFLEERLLADQIDFKRRVDDPWHLQARGRSLSVMLCPSDITEPTFELFEEHDDEDRLPGGSETPGHPHELVRLPTANYVGVFGTIEPDDEIPAPIGDGSFLENRRVRFREFRRGLSHTIIVGERTMAQVPSSWLGVVLQGEDAAARLVGSALEGLNNPLADECDFSSRHPGGANFCWADGHVSLLQQDIDLGTYHQIARLRVN